MNILFLCLFVLFTVIHLRDSFNDDSEKRKRTKPFLLLFLLLYYVFSVKDISIPLVLALLTSWLGDVLLIPKGHKWFTMGGISFLISHLFFILVYCHRIDIKRILWVVVIPVALLYFYISLRIIRIVRDTTPKSMVKPMYGYLLTNSTMNCFALLQLFSMRNAGSAVAYIGAVLFFLSDCLLFLVRYSSHPEKVYKKHFSVMTTYLIGEFLITQGIILLTIH